MTEYTPEPVEETVVLDEEVVLEEPTAEVEVEEIPAVLDPAEGVEPAPLDPAEGSEPELLAPPVPPAPEV